MESMTHEVTEEERLRQLHGIKQEKAKYFMSKVRTLSSGYRDNDPPQAYYKRNGLVPPDRLVTAEMSAAAQASTGGGTRAPPSINHLNKPNTPAETPFGVTEKRPPSSKRRRPASRSRINSDKSATSQPPKTSSSDDDINDAAIDEVTKVQVNLRPSTAPGKRKTSGMKESGLVTMVEEDERARPSTAAAVVRFGEKEDVFEVREPQPPGQKSPSPTRRRHSLKAPNILMFRRRPSTMSGASRTRSAPSTPRATRGGVEPAMLSNVEQERIRVKMVEKARCLQQERIRRELLRIAAEKPDFKPRELSSPVRQVPLLTQSFQTIQKRRRTRETVPTRDPQSAAQRVAMLNYVQQCERGYIGDTYEAKQILIDATVSRVSNLREDVDSFVKS